MTVHDIEESMEKTSAKHDGLEALCPSGRMCGMIRP